MSAKSCRMFWFWFWFEEIKTEFYSVPSTEIKCTCVFSKTQEKYVHLVQDDTHNKEKIEWFLYEDFSLFISFLLNIYLNE